MSCIYCNGNNAPLPLDTFSSDSELFLMEARVVGEDEANPAIEINADGAMIYVRAKFCPQCGREFIERD